MLFISVILKVKKVHEMLCLCLIEGIIDEEEFDLLYEAYRPSNLRFPHSANAKFSLVNKELNQPKVKPISEWKSGIFLCFLTYFNTLLLKSTSCLPMPQWNRVSDLQVPSVNRSSACGMLK